MKPRSLNRIHIADNGLPILVIRPDNPKLALAIAQVALKRQDKALLDRLPDEVGKYTFVGYLAEGGRNILNADCRVIGEIQPGDSLVTNSEHKLP